MLHDFVVDPDHSDNVAVLVYHAYTDPWVTVCGPEHTARYDYYGVTGIPSIRFDGIVGNYLLNASDLNNGYDARIDVDSPIEINLFAYALEDGIVANAEINSGAEVLEGDYKVRFALVSLFYDQFTGNNGQTEWHWDMLDMAPDTDGIDFEIDANSTETFQTTLNWPLELEGNNVDLDNVKVIAFVQDDANHEILQSEWVTVNNEYMFTVEAENTSKLVIPSIETDASFTIHNVGANEDTYDIFVNEDNCNGTAHLYTNQDGEQIFGNSSFTLASMEEFTSIITFNPSSSLDNGGSIIFTIQSQNNPSLVHEIEYYFQESPDILLINGDDEGDNTDYYWEHLEYFADIGFESFTFFQWMGSTDQFTNITWDEDANPRLLIYYHGRSESCLTSNHIENLERILENGGGDLVLTGSRVPLLLGNSDLMEMMGARAPMEYPEAEVVEGIEGTIIGDAISSSLSGGTGANNLGTPSCMLPYNGTPVLMYNGNQRSGILYDGEGYNSLIMGFPFEAMADVNSRENLIYNILVHFLDYYIIEVRETPSGNIPEEFALKQNYPNPFNPKTEIGFDLPEAAEVHLSVFNMLGQEVAVLANGKLEAGTYAASWDAAFYSSGVYFYRLEARGNKESFIQSSKMILMK